MSRGEGGWGGEDRNEFLTLRTNFFADCADASTLSLRDTSNDGLAKLKREEVRMA